MSATREMMKSRFSPTGARDRALHIETIDRGLEMSLDEELILEANH